MPDQTSAPPDSTSEMHPIALPDRLEVIDTLRGFTILGILLVNMPLYGWPNWGPLRAMRTQLPSGPVDEAASWFLWLFAEDKFYPLLSFLFGVGFSIQLAQSDSRANDFLAVYRRRLLALLLIGLVHGFLLWPGDILVRYALMGFLLLPFRERSPKTRCRTPGAGSHCEDPEKTAITASKQCCLRHGSLPASFPSLGTIFSCAPEWNVAEIL